MIKEISFSKKAVERIDQLIAKKPSGTFFRIAIKGGGCSGFKYDFSEELMGASFKISNPKTKSSCGCGVSISF